MSNPNNALGEWLLDNVLNIPQGELITYSHLITAGTDSLEIEKISDELFKINFLPLKSYAEYTARMI